MHIITKKIHETEYAHILALPSFFEDCCYIDIETTGFNRNRHMIYLIGLIFKIKDSFVLRQYLCEKNADEYELLYRLNNEVSHFKYLIHYNGQSFDLPFIQARLALYNIPEQISRCQSIDYYQALKPFKNFLKTDDLKLKTVEKILGFKRYDPFNGGELIEIYHTYTRGNIKLEPTLLLHNEEDMMGLYLLNAFYPFFSIYFSEKTEEHFLEIISENMDGYASNLRCSCPLPKSNLYYMFKHQTPYGYIECLNNQLACSLPIYSGTLKYYYSDYKNYYYLPVEDYAIHKSVANYVHRDYRQKANKYTAYVKKKDTFVRCPLSEKEIKRLQNKNTPTTIFHDEVDETYSYIQIDEFKTIASNLFNSLIKKFLMGI